MRLNAPKNTTFIVAVIVGVLGILLEYGLVDIGGISEYSTLMIIFGFVLLALSTMLKDL